MKAGSFRRGKYISLALILQALFAHSLIAQYILGDIDNPHSQADYVIITPASYAPIMQPLASHRQSRNGFRVAIVTTEAIYQIFGVGVRADSAIRAFVTFALTSWSNPKPQYFLLAGNVNTIPSHKEPGIEFTGEDSISVDQWFVEGVSDTTFARPAAAIGRFPGWDEPHMYILVGKTIFYEQQPDSSCMNKSIAVADYLSEEGPIFEQFSNSIQQRFARRWRDTTSVHVRVSSPQHKTRAQFRELWNRGASFVSLTGHTNQTIFSNSRYFLISDIDSLAESSPLPVIRLVGSGRFENRDTLPFATKFLLVPGKGGICTIAPSGLAYFNEGAGFWDAVVQRLAATSTETVGKAILNAKRSALHTDGWRKETLLGDPALVVRTAIIAGVDPKAGSVPGEFALHQNYPNPFNPTTLIKYELAKDAALSLSVFDILGREVAKLESGFKKAGKYDVAFDASSLSSGIYIYRLQAAGVTLSRKMMMAK